MDHSTLTLENLHKKTFIQASSSQGPVAPFSVYRRVQSLEAELTARPLGIQFAGAIYHVTARGNGRQRLFHHGGDYQRS